MYQHLEQGLVSDAFSSRDHARFCEIGLGQPQGYLNGGRPIELTDKAGTSRRRPLFRGSGMYAVMTRILSPRSCICIA